ncbi:LptM family lipoprotein [Anaerostipes sp.]|uniref:LptM family lipoprotein n=1 Tax=Anaerostipes sp. TaxID=1872530 RepID=UPI0025C41147|nr:hypothetical protein [Anaerostipes sp.]MBS7007933.1 hypothetical protein [Anaerostipes sp.]
MKKVLLALITLVLTMSLVGCGSKKKEGTKKHTVEGADITYKLPESWKESDETKGVFQKESGGKIVVTFQVEVTEMPTAVDINTEESLNEYLGGIKNNNPYYKDNLKAESKEVDSLKGQYISFDAENDNGEMKYQGFVANAGEAKIVTFSMFYTDSKYKEKFDDIMSSVKAKVEEKKDDTKLYKVDGTGLTYRIPKNWKQTESDETTFHLEENGEGVLVFQAAGVDADGEDINDKATLNSFIQEISSSNEINKKSLEIQNRTVNNIKGKYVTFDMNSEDVDMKCQIFLLTLDDKIIYFTTFYQDEKYEDQLDNVLSTLIIQE